MKKLLLILPLALILCFVFGCQDKAAMAELEEFKAQAALEEQNKEFAEYFFEELNKGNIEILNETCAPDYLYYYPSKSPNPISVEKSIESLKITFQAFPDVNYNIEKLYVVGKTIITWISMTGTHQGEFQGIPADLKDAHNSWWNALLNEDTTKCQMSVKYSENDALTLSNSVS